MRWPDPPKVRFWSKVQMGGPDECWPWVAALGTSGYGRFYMNGKTLQAHRTAYEFTQGQIPEGYQIDHLCRNRVCVNPKHLEPVTPQENTQRGIYGAGKIRKTDPCPKCGGGWSYCGTKRFCRTCHNAKRRKG